MYVFLLRSSIQCVVLATPEGYLCGLGRDIYFLRTSSYSAGVRSYAASRLRQRSSFATCPEQKFVSNDSRDVREERVGWGEGRGGVGIGEDMEPTLNKWTSFTSSLLYRPARWSGKKLSPSHAATFSSKHEEKSDFSFASYAKIPSYNSTSVQERRPIEMDSTRFGVFCAGSGVTKPSCARARRCAPSPPIAHHAMDAGFRKTRVSVQQRGRHHQGAFQQQRGWHL